MADFPAPVSPATSTPPGASRPLPINAALLVYALFAIAALIGVASHGFPLFAPLMGVVGIVAIIIAYVKRDEAAGSWLASHFSWQIRTFWWSLLWAMVGALVLRHAGPDPDRHPDRVRDLGRRHDLGDLPRGARLPAVPREPAGAGDLAALDLPRPLPGGEGRGEEAPSPTAWERVRRGSSRCHCVGEGWGEGRFSAAAPDRSSAPSSVDPLHQVVERGRGAARRRAWLTSATTMKRRPRRRSRSRRAHARLRACRS